MPEQRGQPLPRLSVVLSFKNEEDNIPVLIGRLRAVFAEEESAGRVASHELVFVNDASTDRSLEILADEARRSRDIRVVNMSRTFGITPCVLAGLGRASGDLVVYMDADLQDPPEVIHDMLRAWRENPGVDVVHTVRLSRAGESRFKLAVTSLGYWILKKAMNVAIIPDAGDFKLLSRRVVDHLVRFQEQKPFMRGLVHWLGFRQAKVFYHRQPRFGGATKFPIIGRGVFKNFVESALISFSDVPLYFVSLTGIAVSCLSFLYLAFVVVEKFRGKNIPGWSAIMAAVIFLGGVQLIALGIIGLYIGTIYVETKRRPNFIVESEVGFDGGEGPHTLP